MAERKLKEHWCQEKLEFCRPDGTNEALQEVAKILEREILSPDRVKAIYEAKIKKLAHVKWDEAGKPEGRDLEFWLAAEKEQHEKDVRFGGVLTESALPNYGGT